MFNPNSQTQLQRLKGAIVASRKEMQDFQDKRLEVYRQFVGKHYKNGTSQRVPLPMLSLAITTILRKLSSSEPQALVTTRISSQRPSAYSFELGINRALRDMDFGRAMKTWAMEAIMAPLGVLKVALDVTEVQDFADTQVWVGNPVAQPILYDDWVQDMSARRVDQFGFCGNRFVVPKEYALTSGLWDPEVVERIAKQEKVDDSSTQVLSRDKGRFDEDYRDMIELWDIWLPDEGLVVTLSSELEDLPPLRTVQWNGPPSGPYHFLWFDEVPGNAMPLPPVAMWRDIHEVANRLFNKLCYQALRQKKLVAVRSDSVKDGKLMVTGEDGEALVVDNPEGVGEVSLGGIDNQNFGFVLQLGQLHNKYSGNPEGIAGLGPQSPTLGQDQLLHQASNERIAAMQEQVDKAVTSAMRAVAFFLLNNPAAEIPITHEVGGMNIEAVWSQDQMEGSPDDYEIELVPHSLRRKGPEERLAEVNNFMQTLVALAPIAQAAGIIPNIEAYIKTVARLSNMPELNDLVIYSQGQALISDDQIPTPPTSAKQSVPRIRTEKTPAGQESALISKLMGNGEAA